MIMGYVFTHLSIFFSQQNVELLETMRFIVTVIVTIFISIAIALLNGRKSLLDLYTIFDKVLDLKSIIFGLSISAAPLLLWGYPFNVTHIQTVVPVFHFILFSIWVGGLIALYKSLRNTYTWLRKINERESFRKKFLEDLKQSGEIIDVFGEIFGTDGLSYIEERNLFGILSRKYEDFLKDITTIDSGVDLLKGFASFINKRNLYFLLAPGAEDTPGFFEKILEWHYQAWKKEYLYLTMSDNTGISGFGKYSGLSRVLNDIVVEVVKRSLKEGETYALFYQLKEHGDKYGKEAIAGEIHSYQYLESLPIFNVFLDNLSDSPEWYDVETEYFPKEWKITVENLQNKNHSIFAQVWWSKFHQWVRDRIDNGEEKYDKKVDIVIGLLFPDVNSILWSWIIIFMSRSWGGDERMKAMIEGPKNFGFSVSGPTSFADDGEELNRNTVEFAVLFFKGWFLEIDSYIAELEKLEGNYAENKIFEGRRRELLMLFTDIQKKLNSDEKTTSK